MGALLTSCVDRDGIWRDEEGVIHGSGVMSYYYDGDKTKLQRVDTYREGEILKSEWYRPDGAPVAETRWRNGSGMEYYLHDDGSIRIKMPMRDGTAHGIAVYYNESGEVIRRQKYVDGVQVDSDKDLAP